MNLSPSPDISVIIPVYRDWQDLTECLRCLSTQLYPPAAEIILINNDASEPCPIDLREFDNLSITIVDEPVAGSYAARNSGIKNARSQILAFIDADCRPNRNWLRIAFERMHSSNPATIMGGAVELTFEDESAKTIAELYESRHAFLQEKNVQQLGFSVTANLVTSRSTFNTAGAFDAQLYSGGDREWCNRALRSGAEIRYVPELIVTHPARRTTRQLLTKFKRIAGGHVELRRRKILHPNVSERKFTWWLLCPPKADLAAFTRSLVDNVKSVRFRDTFQEVKLFSLHLLIKYTMCCEYFRVKHQKKNPNRL